jgi:hypothetical protein
LNSIVAQVLDRLADKTSITLAELTAVTGLLLNANIQFQIQFFPATVNNERAVGVVLIFSLNFSLAFTVGDSVFACVGLDPQSPLLFRRRVQRWLQPHDAPGIQSSRGMSQLAVRGLSVNASARLACSAVSRVSISPARQLAASRLGAEEPSSLTGAAQRRIAAARRSTSLAESGDWRLICVRGALSAIQV